MEVAKAFFQKAQAVVDVSPRQVFTDGLNSYTRAIQEELGDEVKHEVLPCLGNPIEQSHRGIKQRYYPTLGVGVVESAQLRSINSSAPDSAWRNSCLYRIDETTFYSESMRCKRYLRPLRGEKKGRSVSLARIGDLKSHF